MASFLKFKAGVIVSQQAIIAAAAINAFRQLGIDKDCTITAGSDGKHKANSLHYANRALDIRTKHLTPTERDAFVKTLQKRLGPAYAVILEDAGLLNEHAHAEFDPK